MKEKNENLSQEVGALNTKINNREQHIGKLKNENKNQNQQIVYLEKMFDLAKKSIEHNEIVKLAYQDKRSNDWYYYKNHRDAQIEAMKVELEELC